MSWVGQRRGENHVQPRSAGMGTCRRTDRQTACGPPTGVPWGHRSGSLGGGVQEGPALLTQAWGGTGGFRGRPQGEPAASSTVEGQTGHLNPQLWGWGEERQEGRKRRTETGGRERVGEGRWGGEGREGASASPWTSVGLQKPSGAPPLPSPPSRPSGGCWERKPVAGHRWLCSCPRRRAPLCARLWGPSSRACL